MISAELKFLLVHSSIYGLGTVLSRVLAFFLLPLYTRYLTPEDYGVLEAIDVSTFLIGIVITVDIGRALSRFYYESDNPIAQNTAVTTTYVNYTAMALLFAPVLYSIANPLSHLLFKSRDYAYPIRLGLASMLLGGYADIGMLYLRLLKRPFLFIFITATRLISLISLNVLFIVSYKMGILGVLYSSLLVRALFSLVLTAAILCRTGLSFSTSVSRELFKFGLPIIPSNIANAAVKQSDKYFVLYLLSTADMGLYSVGLKFANPLHELLTIPFIMVWLPRRFEIMNRPEAKHIYAKVFNYSILLVISFGLVLSVFLPEILKVMVTPEFRKVGQFVPVLMLSLIILHCHYHFDFGILYSRKTQYLAYINFACAIVYLGVNYILIRAYGLTGAAISSVAVFAIQASLLYLISNKLFSIPYEFPKILVYLLFAVAIYLLSTIALPYWYPLVLLSKFFLLALYPTLLILSGAITRQETDELRQIFQARIKPVLMRWICVSSLRASLATSLRRPPWIGRP